MSREEQFDYLFKIVIIGDSGVGKTNLLSRFVDNTFSIDSKPTIGVEFAVKTLTIDSKIVKNQIWDTAGQERFRAITNAYYRGAQGAIIVYDTTKAKTFQNISKWLSELRENAEPDITVMLLGNKSDLENKDVKLQAVQDFIQTNKLLHMETSALSGKNVQEAFNSLIKEIFERVNKTPEPTPIPPAPSPSDNKPKPTDQKKVIPKPNQSEQKDQKFRIDDKKKVQTKKKSECCK